jgi:translocation and assembly module TamA
MRHPLALTDGQTITARHEDEKLDVIVIAPGPELRFGNAVTGNDAVRTDRVGHRGPANRTFDPPQLCAPRRCAVQVRSHRPHRGRRGCRQHLPMTIAIVEQTPRRIGAGVEYSTVSD